MKPGTLPITIFQGDSFGDDWLITLPSLVPLGGPSTLASATVSAQVRKKPESPDPPMAAFDVQVVDATLRQIRPKLTRTQTAELTSGGVWDLQVTQGSWTRTILRGDVTLERQVTR